MLILVEMAKPHAIIIITINAESNMLMPCAAADGIRIPLEGLAEVPSQQQLPALDVPDIDIPAQLFGYVVFVHNIDKSGAELVYVVEIDDFLEDADAAVFHVLGDFFFGVLVYVLDFHITAYESELSDRHIHFSPKVLLLYLYDGVMRFTTS